MTIERRRRLYWWVFQAVVWVGTLLTTLQYHSLFLQATIMDTNNRRAAFPLLDTTTTAILATPSLSSSSLSSPPPTWPGQPSYDLSNPDATHLIRIDKRPPPVHQHQAPPHPVAQVRTFFQAHLDEFLQVYKHRPDQTNTCGIRFNHAFAIYTITKRLQPTTIVESGVNSGQSTYFFRKASNANNNNDNNNSTTTKIISIDPEIKPICGQPVRWIDNTNNEYLTGDAFVDFDNVNWSERIQAGEIDPDRTLIFIDDHRGFFHRFPTFVKFGFRHVMNEDNYKEQQGATKWDRANLTPKQMFRVLPQHANTKWLLNNLLLYAEFPPLLPPVMAQNTTHAPKVQGGFLHFTDDLRAIEEPILRPDLNFHDAQIFQHIAQELQLDATLQESQSYQEFMGYCFLAYMEISPNATMQE